VEITWDDRKEAANIKKHGIDFDEAATVILNPLSLYNSNKHKSGYRFEYLGHSDRGRVLFVVTLEERENSSRILSARKANPHERETYEQGF
jgi:uncharacterized DUF497 family protein